MPMREGTLSSRDIRRKEIRLIRRRVRIDEKITALLTSCSARITHECLTDEEIEVLSDCARRARLRTIDYYPIPKVLHNKIRRYVHNHPRFTGTNLYHIVSLHTGTFAFDNIPRYDNLLTMERLLEALRDISVSAPSSIEYRPW